MLRLRLRYGVADRRVVLNAELGEVRKSKWASRVPGELQKATLS